MFEQVYLDYIRYNIYVFNIYFSTFIGFLYQNRKRLTQTLQIDRVDNLLIHVQHL